jgi:glycerol-3-phosphate acyltransferase PlsY
VGAFCLPSPRRPESMAAHMPWLPLLLSVGTGYLIGSIPFGFLIAKSRGIDIRRHGSGNIGATNVLRVVGKKEGIFAFILDFLKGLLGVFAGFYFGGEQYAVLMGIAATVAVILGHNYTFWLGFKGGKGIATSAGALVALMPWAILVALGFWLILFYSTRIVSLASIAAALSLPVTIGGMLALGLADDVALLPLSLAVAALATWRHRSNIERLRRGEEPRFGQKKKEKAQAAGTPEPGAAGEPSQESHPSPEP